MVNPITIPQCETVDDLRVQLQQALQKLVTDINTNGPGRITLTNDLDAGNKRLANLGTPKLPNDAVRLRDIQGGVGGGGRTFQIINSGGGGTSTNTSSAITPDPPTNAGITITKKEDSFFIGATWTKPSPLGDVIGYDRQVKWFVDSACTTPDSDWILLGPVYDGDVESAVAGPFPKPQANEGTKWAKLQVRSANWQGDVSVWVDATNTASVSAMDDAPNPGGLGQTRIEYDPATSSWRFVVIVTPPGDLDNTNGYEAFAQRFDSTGTTPLDNPIDLGWIDAGGLNPNVLVTDWWTLPASDITYWKIIVYPINLNGEFGDPNFSPLLTLYPTGGGDATEIVNGNFESLAEPWPTFLEPGHTNNWTFTTADHYNGTQCYSLSGNAANTGKYAVVYNPRKLIAHPGQTWAFEFYYKASSAVWSGAASGFTFNVDEERSDGSFIRRTISILLPAVGVWTKINIQGSVQGADTTKLNVWFNSIGLTSGAVFIDSVTAKIAIDASSIIPGGLADWNLFNNAIRPVGVGSVLPNPADPAYPEGAIFVLTGGINGTTILKKKGGTWVYATAATEILAGTLGVGVVYAGTINAEQMSAGTLGAGVIYGGSITAAQITSGTFTGLSLILNKNGVTSKLDNQADSFGNIGITVTKNSDGSFVTIGPGVVRSSFSGGGGWQLSNGAISLYSSNGLYLLNITSPPGGVGSIITYGVNNLLSTYHPDHGRATNPGTPVSPFLGTLPQIIAYVNQLYSNLYAAGLIS